MLIIATVPSYIISPLTDGQLTVWYAMSAWIIQTTDECYHRRASVQRCTI